MTYIMPKSIFSLEAHRDVFKDYLQASSMHPLCYTSQQFLDAEIEKIFLKNWLFAGREEKITNPGDFFVVDLIGESVLVTKGEDGQARAFHNFCRHRGLRLAEGAGTKSLISCPYHRWCYDTKGALVRAPDMEKSEDWRPDENGLIPVRLESWEGFLFINFSDDAPSLMQHLGDLPDKFSSYRLADMTCVKAEEYLVGCNWKLYTEVDMEDYHAPSVHPKSIGLQVFPRQPSCGEYETTFFEKDRTISIPRPIRGPCSPISRHCRGWRPKARSSR